MAATTSPLDAVPTGPRSLTLLWGRHLLAFFFPAVSLTFLWTGPHPWYVAPAFMLPLVTAHWLDCRGDTVTRQPSADLPAWPFDLLVYALAAAQILVVAETVRLFAGAQGIFSLDFVMTFSVVGAASGFSIVTAHELIHRPKVWEQQLGRLLLCSVLYEHFYTEHLRGHHVKVGTPEDPATARFGESYERFFTRTVPAQFRSAWRLESRRLGDENLRLWDPRMLRHRVLHGLVLEWGVAGGILLAFGPAAFAAFVLQAFSAVRLLEAVNYFEHWGLVRRGRKVAPADSWDTHSRFTFYALIGLTRHADHHAFPMRPFQQLRVWQEAPLLPHGYVGTVDLLMIDNREYQRRMAIELGERGLGPFPTPVGGTEALEALARAQAGERRPLSGLARRWRGLPVWLRRVLFLGGVVGISAAGAHWEAAGGEMGLVARLALHAWILGVFAFVIPFRRRLQERLGKEREVLAWAVALGLLFALGLLTDRVLALLA